MRARLLLAILLCASACSDSDAGPRAAADAAVGRRHEVVDAGAGPLPVPDLRWKLVGASFSFLNQGLFNTSVVLGGGISHAFTGAFVLAPLQVGLGDVVHVAAATADVDAGGERYATGDWMNLLLATDPPIAARALTTHGVEFQLEARLDELHAAGQLITALHLTTAPASVAAYGLTAMGRADGAPVFAAASRRQLPRSELEASVANDAKSGLIVTALAGNGSQILYLAYRGEDSSALEAQVRAATFDDLELQAEALARDGYVITAFGKADAQLLLVGTRAPAAAPAHHIALLTQDLPGRLDAPVVAWVRRDQDTKLILER